MPNDMAVSSLGGDGMAQREQASTKVLFAHVPTDLHQRARIRAVREGRPMARLIEQAVTQYLESRAETGSAR